MQVTALRSWERGCCSKNGWGKLTSHSLGEETRRQEVTSKATDQTGRPLLSHMCPSPSHISPSPASHIFPSSSSHTPPFSISFRISPSFAYYSSLSSPSHISPSFASRISPPSSPSHISPSSPFLTFPSASPICHPPSPPPPHIPRRNRCAGRASATEPFNHHPLKGTDEVEERSK